MEKSLLTPVFRGSEFRKSRTEFCKLSSSSETHHKKPNDGPLRKSGGCNDGNRKWWWQQQQLRQQLRQRRRQQQRWWSSQQFLQLLQQQSWPSRATPSSLPTTAYQRARNPPGPRCYQCRCVFLCHSPRHCTTRYRQTS